MRALNLAEIPTYIKLTSMYPVTRPSSPVRTNDKLVGGGEGSKASKEGIDSWCSQCLWIDRHRKWSKTGRSLTSDKLAANDREFFLGEEVTWLRFRDVLVLEMVNQ